MSNDPHICNLLYKCNWKWAKTYEKFAPHWYTKKVWFKRTETFFFLAKVISDKGVIEKFGNREYKYYYCGDYKYWIMSHWSKEILINRAKVNENK
mgnify:FL=1